MRPRQRVLRTLEFAGPDRPPRDLWALPWVHTHAADELRALQEAFPPDFARPSGVLGTGDRSAGRPNRRGSYTDEWGCLWHCAEDGVVGEVKGPPLADWSALAGYRPPWEVLRRADWSAADRWGREHPEQADRFLLAGTSIRPFERMQFLRGTEGLLIDLAYGTAEVRLLRDMVHEFFLAELDGWCRTGVDGISFMDDWGSQKALLISPAAWRDFFKPLYRDYCNRIRSAGKKVFFHSDGHIEAIYGDLIEIGVDAVNSQLFCMDIEALGRRHRERVTFWGEIDRQRVLPFGTVLDVRRAVARIRRALGDAAGGVIAQCEWGKDAPAENVRAVFEAWQEPLDKLLAD